MYPNVNKILDTLIIQMAASGGARGVRAAIFFLPPNFLWNEEKWEFSCTKLSKRMTFWGSCPTEVVKTKDFLKVLPPPPLKNVFLPPLHLPKKTLMLAPPLMAAIYRFKLIDDQIF